MSKLFSVFTNNLYLYSGVFYISTYEGVRHVLHQKNVSSSLRALIAGGCASAVGQTIIVPFDVLSQHLMMMGVHGREEQVTATKMRSFTNKTHF